MVNMESHDPGVLAALEQSAGIWNINF